MTTSRVPAAIDALLATAKARFASDVLVTDGPLGSLSHTGTIVEVGIGGEAPAVTGTQSKQAGMGTRRSEDFTIGCGISANDGGMDMKVSRDRVAVALAEFEAMLTADPHLGGVVDFAELGPDFEWLQSQHQDGAFAGLLFTVHVRALL